MGVLFVILIIAAVVYWLNDEPSSTPSSGGPTVSTNIVEYPSDLHCQHCSNKEFNYMRDIDIDTWDMNCPKCGKVAYEHPNREARKEQLDWLFEQTKD